jgi:hypothetical protein
MENMTLIQMAEMMAGPALTDNQRAFFNAVQGNSAPLAADESRVRMWQGEVVVTLIPLNIADRAGVLLQGIRALHPAKGHGSKALDWLCALADEYRQIVEVLPEVLPSDESKLQDEKDLREWYTRRGFRGGMMMRRMPAGPQ